MVNRSRVNVRAGSPAILAIGLAVLVAGLLPSASHASVITYVTPPGSMVGGLPVNAEATFTTGLNSLTIDLVNDLADPTSVIQCLSDLGFTLSTGQTIGTLTSSTGLERTVHGDGTYTDGSVVSTGWQLENTPLRLHVLGTPTAPMHTVIGPPGNSNLYDNANGSIAGNGPHNPFLTGTVDFTLNIPGVTSASTVSDMYFSFGTTEGNNVPGVPEPASAALLALGAGLLRRR